MARPSKHDEKAILEAAAILVAAGGPRAATVGAICNAIGAPSGSIYHRFTTRDELLGRLWLDRAARFQDAWVRALEEKDAVAAGLAAALSLPRVAREDFDGARIMLLHRRDDFLADGWPEAMKSEAKRLGDQAAKGISQMARRLFGRDTPATRQSAAFATVDIPYGAVRRSITAGKPPPAALDELIEKAYRGVVGPRKAGGRR
jgi:AcrR family transcriptional regulator